MRPKVPVTVGVPTFQRDPHLLRTLTDLFAQTVAPTEIIVVDQNEIQLSERAGELQQYACSENVRWLHQAVPSLTKARNLVLKESNGEIVLFVDDDVRLCAEFISAHWSAYSDGAVSAVGGPVLGPGEVLTYSYSATGAPLRTALLLPNSLGVPLIGIPHLVGCNHSVRRHAAFSIGGYDEQFEGPALGEDYDFAFRLHERGHLVAYRPEASLLHLRAPSGGCRISSDAVWAEWQKSVCSILFCLRHGQKAGVTLRYLRAALRAGPLRRENILGPWRQIHAWRELTRACATAWRKHREGPRLPLVS